MRRWRRGQYRYCIDTEIVLFWIVIVLAALGFLGQIAVCVALALGAGS